MSRRPLGSISKAYYDEKAGKLYAAFNYPGVVAHVGSIDVATGDLERIVDIKGPVIYTVTSLAYDPEAQQIYYTTDNGAHRDLVRVDPRTGKTEQLMKDVRIGDLAFNRADKSIWGIRHLNGIVDAGAHPSALQAVGRGFIRSRTAPSSTTSTCRPTARACRHRLARSTASRTSACSRPRSCSPAT